MKKILAILIILIINRINYSQTFASYGFSAGLTSTFLSGKKSGEDVSTFARIGFTGGFFGEFFKSKNFSTIVGLYFVQKGGNDKLINPDRDNYSTLNLLSVPVMAKLIFPVKIFYLSAGPRIDILINKNDGLDIGQFSNINPVNFGISFLAGLEFFISKKTSLIIESSYSPDITTYIYKNVDGDIITRNISFEFKTGLKFNY